MTPETLPHFLQQNIDNPTSQVLFAELQLNIGLSGYEKTADLVGKINNFSRTNDSLSNTESAVLTLQTINQIKPLITKLQESKGSNLNPEETRFVSNYCQSENNFARFCHITADRLKNSDPEKKIILNLAYEHLLEESIFAGHFNLEEFQLKAITNTALVARTISLLEIDTAKRGKTLQGQIDKLEGAYDWARILRISPRLKVENRDEVTLKYLANCLNSLSELYINVAELTDDEELTVYCLQKARNYLKAGVDYVNRLQEKYKDRNALDQEGYQETKMAIFSNYAYTFILENFENAKNAATSSDTEAVIRNVFTDYFKPFLVELSNDKTPPDIRNRFFSEACIRSCVLVGSFIRTREEAEKRDGKTMKISFREHESQPVNLLLSFVADKLLSAEIGKSAYDESSNIDKKEQLIVLLQNLWSHAEKFISTHKEEIETDDNAVIDKWKDEFAKRGWLKIA